MLHSTKAAQSAYDLTTGPEQAVGGLSDRPYSTQTAGDDSLISSLRVPVEYAAMRPDSQAERPEGPDSNLAASLKVDVADEQQRHMQAMSVYGTAGRNAEEQLQQQQV